MVPKRRWWLLLAFLLLAILLMLTLNILPKSDCSTSEIVPATLEVVHNQRNYLGFNTDRDSLNFGKVTPETQVKRSVQVGYSLPAQVQVSAETDFSSWLRIDRAQFMLSPDKSQEVIFTVDVPKDAAPGNYSGDIKFCFSD